MHLVRSNSFRIEYGTQNSLRWILCSARFSNLTSREKNSTQKFIAFISSFVLGFDTNTMREFYAATSSIQQPICKKQYLVLRQCLRNRINYQTRSSISTAMWNLSHLDMPSENAHSSHYVSVCDHKKIFCRMTSYSTYTNNQFERNVNNRKLLSSLHFHESRMCISQTG